MYLIRLKEIREENDNTQQEVAEILNVKRGTYASWECGSDIIPIRKLYEFANHYNKSIDYILELTKEDKKTVCEKKINLMATGERLKSIRNSFKLSQLKIADSIGINQSTWWAYENGKTLITTSTLLSLIKKYNFSIDWILGRVK